MVPLQRPAAQERLIEFSSYLQNIFALYWTAHSFVSTLHTGKSHLCRLERRCRSTSGKLQAEAESVARMPHMQNSCTSYTTNRKGDKERRLTPEEQPMSKTIQNISLGLNVYHCCTYKED